MAFHGKQFSKSEITAAARESVTSRNGQAYYVGDSGYSPHTAVGLREENAAFHPTDRAFF